MPYLASWAQSAAPDTFERIAALVDRLEDALSDASMPQDAAPAEADATATIEKTFGLA